MKIPETTDRSSTPANKAPRGSDFEQFEYLIAACIAGLDLQFEALMEAINQS
jgi:hypothetical protein